MYSCTTKHFSISKRLKNIWCALCGDTYSFCVYDLLKAWSPGQPCFWVSPAGAALAAPKLKHCLRQIEWAETRAISPQWKDRVKFNVQGQTALFDFFLVGHAPGILAPRRNIVPERLTPLIAPVQSVYQGAKKKKEKDFFRNWELSLCAKLITCFQVFLSTLAWQGVCTCSASVSHTDMWYKACFSPCVCSSVYTALTRPTLAETEAALSALEIERYTLASFVCLTIPWLDPPHITLQCSHRV